MPSKVLLVSINRCVAPDAVFPLGLSFLNAALRTNGYETHWCDLWASPRTLESALASFQPDYVGISIRNIDDVLIRSQNTYVGDLPALCQTVRRAHHCPIILGGSGFTLFPTRLLTESGADFGVQGEGEDSLLALLKALETGASYEAIPGLVYRRGSECLANPVRTTGVPPRLEEVDRPSALAAQYLQSGGMLNVQTQRGCVHTCCYCTYPVIEGRSWRTRQPDDVAEEMAQAQGQGARYVFLVDSVFNSTPEHVTKICEALIRRGVRMPWGCFLRPQGLSRELVELMARAGLQHIEFGSDSFCDSVLDAYHKRFSFEDILESSNLARQAGIDYCHYLICGGPGETQETLRVSFDRSRRLPGAVIMAMVGMRIYPGTHLWRRAVQEGRIARNADLLAPAYYLAAGLDADDVFEQLRSLARHSPNWIVGDTAPQFAALVERLRRRGVTGPLWSYLALVQRIMPGDLSYAG